MRARPTSDVKVVDMDATTRKTLAYVYRRLNTGSGHTKHASVTSPIAARPTRIATQEYAMKSEPVAHRATAHLRRNASHHRANSRPHGFPMGSAIRHFEDFKPMVLADDAPPDADMGRLSRPFRTHRAHDTAHSLIGKTVAPPERCRHISAPTGRTSCRPFPWRAPHACPS